MYFASSDPSQRRFDFARRTEPRLAGSTRCEEVSSGKTTSPDAPRVAKHKSQSDRLVESGLTAASHEAMHHCAAQ